MTHYLETVKVEKKKTIVIVTRVFTPRWHVSIFYFCSKVFLFNIHTLLCLETAAEK